jgi:2Fe-2S ferredoxin
MTDFSAAETAAAVAAADAFDEALADGTFSVIDRHGRAHRLPGVDGMSVMEILRAADLPVLATCGGAAACGTCHVYVDPAFASRLALPRAEEEWQLDHLLAVTPQSRLSCQILWRKDLLDGLIITLAPEA